MPPRVGSSAARVRMNATREDEAYKKEILSKANDGFKAELTAGKSERITRNLKNQDEGTLRLQEYLMAAEVDARPPEKIETLMDQSDAIKLQKSLVALQNAPLQRSQVPEPPKYEITSEDKDSSSSYHKKESTPEVTTSTTSTSTVSNLSSTSTPPPPPTPPSKPQRPKDVPKPVITPQIVTPTPDKQKTPTPKKPTPVMQKSQEDDYDEYTDEYVMVKQRVKRRDRKPTLPMNKKVITAGEPGMLYAYRKAWGCAEYFYASCCGILALMVLFIFSYLLMHIWTSCSGLVVPSGNTIVGPSGRGDHADSVPCTGPTLHEIQALLNKNSKHLLKEWSAASADLLGDKTVQTIATRVTAKLSDEYAKLEAVLREAFKKIDRQSDEASLSTLQIKKLTQTIKDEVSGIAKTHVSTLSDAIARLEKEVSTAQAATASLFNDFSKSLSGSAAATSKKASEKVKAAAERVSDAAANASGAAAAGLGNINALVAAIEALSAKVEKSNYSDAVSKAVGKNLNTTMKEIERSLVSEVHSQVKGINTEVIKLVDTSLAGLRVQVENLSTTINRVLATAPQNTGTKGSAGAGSGSAATTAAINVATTEALRSMQTSIDSVIAALKDLSGKVANNNNNNDNSSGSNGGNASALSVSMKELDEMRKRTVEHITAQTQNATATILKRIDASDNLLVNTTNAQESRLKTGLASLIKSLITKDTISSSTTKSSSPGGVVDELRLKYTDFAKQVFGTRIAGKSEDVTNIVENLKTFVSGNDRIRLLFTEDLSPGVCWPTQKKGYIVLRFKNPVTLFYSGISHPAAPKLPAGRSSAPHNLEFTGRTTSGQEVSLGKFTFDPEGPEQQAFQLEGNNNIIQVKLEFTNNGAEYTCLYNLGLFGERVEAKANAKADK